MTNAVHGKSGVVDIGGVIAEVTTWNMNRTAAADEATSMTSGGYQEFVEGLRGWAGSFTTLVYAAKLGLQNAATFQVGASASTYAPVCTGAIIITDEPIQVDVNGVVQYQYTFTGTGSASIAVA